MGVGFRVGGAGGVGSGAGADEDLEAAVLGLRHGGGRIRLAWPPLLRSAGQSLSGRGVCVSGLGVWDWRWIEQRRRLLQLPLLLLLLRVVSVSSSEIGRAHV